jgi:hypothetical protein
VEDSEGEPEPVPEVVWEEAPVEGAMIAIRAAVAPPPSRGAPQGQNPGDHDGQVTRGYLFNCLQPAQPFLGTRGSCRAALGQKVGAGAQVTRSGPGAAPSQGTGAEAVGTRGSPGAALSQEVGARAVGTRGSPRVTPS